VLPPPETRTGLALGFHGRQGGVGLGPRLATPIVAAATPSRPWEPGKRRHDGAPAVRSISAAVHLSRPKLAHETFAAATKRVGALPVRLPSRRLLTRPDGLRTLYGPLAHSSWASAWSHPRRCQEQEHRTGSAGRILGSCPAIGSVAARLRCCAWPVVVRRRCLENGDVLKVTTPGARRRGAPSLTRPTCLPRARTSAPVGGRDQSRRDDAASDLA
jgi:hypothetical protein